MKKPFFITLVLVALMASFSTLAEETPDKNQRVDVDQVRKQYWRQGAEYSVVQNRLYPKKHRFEAYVFGGFVSTDPFLSVKNLGGSLAFHFSEYLSASLMGWQSFSTGSTALDVLQSDTSTTANVNHPRSYAGTEGALSLMYGKLSLLGSAILYYDLHFLLGAGLTFTQNGNYVTGHGGIGQQIYLNRYLALRTDYRLMYFREDIKNTSGTLVPRANWTSVITLGVSVFFP